MPDLGPEPGWIEFEQTKVGERTFASGEDRIELRLYADGDGLSGKVWFGPEAEGPPGHAHGGSIATVLDQAMGHCAWYKGHPCVAGQFTVQFRSMAPLR